MLFLPEVRNPACYRWCLRNLTGLGFSVGTRKTVMVLGDSTAANHRCEPLPVVRHGAAVHEMYVANDASELVANILTFAVIAGKVLPQCISLPFILYVTCNHIVQSC